MQGERQLTVLCEESLQTADPKKSMGALIKWATG